MFAITSVRKLCFKRLTLDINKKDMYLLFIFLSL